MGLGEWIGFLALIVSLYILWKIRAVILLFFTAVILAIALNRLVRRLQQSGARRELAIALTVGIVLAISSVFIFLIFTRLSSQFEQLTQLIPLGIEKLRLWIDWLQAKVPELALNNIPNLDNLSQQLQTLSQWIISHIYLFLSNSLNLVINFLLITVLTIMLVVNPVPYRQVIIRLFPAFYRHRVDEILTECEKNLMGWLTGIAFSMSFIGIASTVGLFLLQVQLPLVNGFLVSIFISFNSLCWRDFECRSTHVASLVIFSRKSRCRIVTLFCNSTNRRQLYYTYDRGKASVPAPGIYLSFVGSIWFFIGVFRIIASASNPNCCSNLG